MKKARRDMKIGNSIEAEGKTTKDAINSALRGLGISKDRVKIQILAEEKKGLFGMEGGAQAKVKITVVK